MAWAELTAAGLIKKVIPQLIPSIKPLARPLVRYDMPKFDRELQTCKAVQPVPEGAEYVEFIVEDKPLEVILPIIKARVWAQIKERRSAVEFGGFEWDGSRFDSDEISQSRIQGAAQLAVIAMTAGQPFEIEWTLATNDTRILSAIDMIAVGVALGAHVNDCHVTGRALRQQIDDAETVAAVKAVAWPVDEPEPEEPPEEEQE